MKRRLMLTFDVEDFVNSSSMQALEIILRLLEQFGLRALFFVTGHAAEKLSSRPEICGLLEMHEIGFHSSAHSVHPTVFEYCDVEKYEDAYSASLERETAHIDPLSGEIEGSGGIHALRNLFPFKSIKAYRAPGYCCPPPHLEAMASLGMEYDFSWSLSKTPVRHKGITFYPSPMFLDCERALLARESGTASPLRFLRWITLEKLSVVNFHPSMLVNEDYWDSIYYKGNPQELHEVLPRDELQADSMFVKLEALLRMISRLGKLGLIDASPKPDVPSSELDVARTDIRRAADVFANWPRAFFGYEMKHMWPQIDRFFDVTSALSAHA